MLFLQIVHETRLKLKISTVLYVPNPYRAPHKMVFPQHWRPTSDGVNGWHPCAEMLVFSLEFDRSDPFSQMTRMRDLTNVIMYTDKLR